MTDSQIYDFIREYEIVPRKLIVKFFRADCKEKNKRLTSIIRHLKKNKVIDYDPQKQICRLPAASERDYSEKLIKALYLLAQFPDIDEHYRGNNGIEIFFLRKGDLCEIITLDRETYPLTLNLVNRHCDENNMPKRFVIAQTAADAQALPADILHKLNAAALVTVDPQTGEVLNYTFD